MSYILQFTHFTLGKPQKGCAYLCTVNKSEISSISQTLPLGITSIFAKKVNKRQISGLFRPFIGKSVNNFSLIRTTIQAQPQIGLAVKCESSEVSLRAESVHILLRGVFLISS